MFEHTVPENGLRWLFSGNVGLMEKSSTIYSTSAESFLPGICKELIGFSVDSLGHSFDEEKTIADSLMNNLLKIYNGLLTISKAHEEQDEESPDNCKQSHCFTSSHDDCSLHITLLIIT